MKKLYFRFIAVLISLPMSVIGDELDEEVNPNLLSNPKLTISWLGPFLIGWVSEDESIARAGITLHDEDIFVSRLATSLQITCSASYPVYWDYDNDKVALSRTQDSSLESAILVNTHRVSANFSDPSSYTYYTFLRLNDASSFITSNFTCRSMTNKTLRTSRYISFPVQQTAFAYDEEEEDISYPFKTVMADSLNQTLVLPCSVSGRANKVHLYKESKNSNSTYDEVIPDNKSIRFDPKIGFILKIQDLPSPFGVYKCLVGGYVAGTGLRVLLVNALPADTVSNTTLSTVENNTLNGTASYNMFEIPTFGHIICCYNSHHSEHAKSAKLYIRNCRTKYECKKIRGQMQNVENMRGISSCGRAMNKRGDVFGVFRCVGDDIDVIREYYIPPQIKDFEYIGYTENGIESKGNLSRKKTFSKKYIDDEISKIPPETFISIKTAGVSTGSTYNVYSNIPVTIQCYYSIYLFTYGVRWSILWKNGTTEILPELALQHDRVSVLETFLEQEVSSTLELAFEKDMASITCHAPLLNSTAWVNKTLQLNITESKPPKIKGPDFEVLTWKARDTNKFLLCESDGLGIPNPVFSWIHPWTGSDHYRYDTTSANKLKEELKHPEVAGNSSIIRFDLVKPFITGIYTCILHSASGEARKLFQLNVTDYLNRGPSPQNTANTASILNNTADVSNSSRRRDGEAESATTTSQNSTLANTSIIISVTLLLAGCGAGFAYIWRRFKQQNKLDAKPRHLVLPWQEMANTRNNPYEEFFNL